MPGKEAVDVEIVTVLLSLLIMLAAAKLLAEVFERLRQPAVVGEIIAGIVIGPSLLGWVRPSEVISVFAEIGVIFLLFSVGLETKPESILKVGLRSTSVAALGVLFPFVAGYFIAYAWDGSFVESMFIGAAMVATSVGITARVLGSLGVLNTQTARIILGAAVIDDILGLLILSIASAVGTGGLDYIGIGKTAATALLFVVFVALVGSRLINRAAPMIERLRLDKPFFTFGLILCLGLSVLSVYVGVAAIIGAFLAGMALAEVSEDKEQMHRRISGVTEFLVPFFLVNIGMQLDVHIFASRPVIIFALLLTVAAVLTKIAGCGLGAFGLGKREMTQIGVAMVPRGEVGIVVAQVGLGLGAIGEPFFASVLFMAVATTMLAPPMIKTAFASSQRSNDASESGQDPADDYSRIG